MQHRSSTRRTFDKLLAGMAHMQVDGQQQPRTTASDREQHTHSMQASDLTPKEGVGRCYYTQLPRLIKVSKAYRCMVPFLSLSLVLLCDMVFFYLFMKVQCLFQVKAVRPGKFVELCWLYIPPPLLPGTFVPAPCNSQPPATPSPFKTLNRYQQNCGFRASHVKAKGTASLPTAVPPLDCMFGATEHCLPFFQKGWAASAGSRHVAPAAHSSEPRQDSHAEPDSAEALQQQ